MEGETTFTITATMKDRWVPQFLGMLKTMQIDGKVGHSEVIGFYSDGDGDFRPKFEWSEELPEPAKPSDSPHLESFFDAG